MASRAQSLSLIPDEEVVGHFQGTGDPEWFAELFARYHKKVYFACRRFHADGGAAEDATQETFLRAYEKMNQFSGGDFAGWLMRIAKNICIDQWRKRRSATEVAETDLGESGFDGIAATSMVDSNFTVERIRQEMNLLSAEQRLCLELKIEGYSYEETAVRTGLTVGDVKSHLQNGRRMLWLKMQAAGTMRTAERPR